MDGKKHGNGTLLPWTNSSVLRFTLNNASMRVHYRIWEKMINIRLVPHEMTGGLAGGEEISSVVNMAARYNAFICYSRTADLGLALKIKSALHRLANPWYRLRALTVFLDQTDLAANPDLWPTIETALAQSEFLILLASPEAAASPWVGKEVNWWLQNRSLDKLLIVLTNGELVWNDEASDFSWNDSMPLPDILRRRFPGVPHYLDFRGIKTRVPSDLSLRQIEFRQGILKLAAPLHHRPMAELDGDDVHDFRNIRRFTRSAIALLSWLLVLAVLLLVYSNRQRLEAEKQTRGATAQTLALRAKELMKERRLDRALLLSAHAVRLNASAESVSTLNECIRFSTLPFTFLDDHTNLVHGATFSRDGRLVVAGTDNRGFIFWDTTTMQITNLMQSRVSVAALAF